MLVEWPKQVDLASWINLLLGPGVASRGWRSIDYQPLVLVPPTPLPYAYSAAHLRAVILEHIGLEPATEDKKRK